MSARVRFISAVVFLSVCFLLPGLADAFSVRLQYGFKPGEMYKVTERHHDVGKTVTEMDVMGQPQKFETASDRVSSGTWTVKAVGKGGEGVKIEVNYGQHKGGDRWGSDKMDSARIFGESSAEVVIHPTKGAVKYNVRPADDQIVELMYKARFMWMPELPAGFVRKGASFTHEYVLKSGMYNIKSTDEYYLVEIKDGFANFDVETKQVSIIKLSEAPKPEGMPAGLGMNMADMKLAYKGEGTAVFDVKEGIFIEREIKMSYSDMGSTKGAAAMPGGMTFSSRTEGVVKYKWEMERQ
jgi:hypothetical protein